MRRAWAAGAMASVLLVIYALWFYRSDSGGAMGASGGSSGASVSEDDLRMTAPSPPDLTDSQPEVAATEVAAATRPSSLLPQTPRDPGPGYIRVIPSLDLLRHDVLTTIGEAASQNDERTLSMLQFRYDLSPEDLKAIVAYSTTLLQEDRKFQDGDQRAICARRSEISSLHELGTVLNQHLQSVKAHQESLSRQAESALGPELYSKINNQLLREPRREAVTYDFPVMLVAQDRDFDVEMQRFCGK